MRFACDRCKTRYSIADERVRGKILKIRCKSCANVITVKEGMELPPELAAEPAATPAPASGQGDWPASAANAGAGRLGDRSQRSTTQAPQSTVGAAAAKPAPALGAAFATAMTAPQAPPQLEDEWYVSRDGEQHGPFGLPNAQAWISQQPVEAELYCWCEGFDDWLPVDRIAHFRGLRARQEQAPAAAPAAVAPAAVATPAAAPPARNNDRPLSGPLPLPLLARTPTRPTTGAAPQLGGQSASLAGAEAPPVAVEDQPQFAATMAALAGEGPGSPGTGQPAQAHAAQATQAAGTGRALELPGWPAGGGPANASATGAASGGAGNGRGARGFDAGDLGNQSFSPAAAAAPGRRASGSSSPVPIAPDAAMSSPSLPAASEDDIEFGEVSRVVRIADIGKLRPQPTRAASAAASVRRTGANEVLPAALAGGFSGGALAATATPRPGSLPVAGLRSTGAVPILGGGESARVEVPLVIPATQRRNHALLLGLVAAGLIGAGVVALVLLQSSSSTQDPSLISLSGSNVSDLTIRPDDPRRGNKPATGSGGGADNGSAGSAKPAPGTGAAPGTGVRRPVQNGGAIATNPGTQPGGKIENTPAPSAATPLGGDEVEEMSQRNSTGLQRCYEQALKKDIFLEVKSIKVTISIDTSGVVSNVAMSSHADHALGQCMITRIRNWRFRANSRGLDAKFTVAFGRT